MTNIFSAFANQYHQKKENFEYLYNGEKIINYEFKKLSELNNKDDLINISVYEKNDFNNNSNTNEINL